MVKTSLPFVQLLYRAMHESPALADCEAFRFYAGYEKDTGRRWRAFQQWLDALPAAMHPAIMDGARAGFERFAELWEET